MLLSSAHLSEHLLLSLQHEMCGQPDTEWEGDEQTEKERTNAHTNGDANVDTPAMRAVVDAVREVSSRVGLTAVNSLPEIVTCAGTGLTIAHAVVVAVVGAGGQATVDTVVRG